MPTLKEFRESYPQYNNTPDTELLTALRRKFPQKEWTNEAQSAKDPAPVGATAKPLPQMSALDRAMDDLKSLGTGVGEGAIDLAGAVGAGRDAVKAGVGYLADKVGADRPQAEAAAQLGYGMIVPGGSVLPTPGQIRGPIESFTGEFHRPDPSAPEGAYIQSTGRMLPAVVAGPGSLAARGTAALGAGVGSEGAGQLAQRYAPSAEPYARAGGAVVGGGLLGVATRAPGYITGAGQGERIVANTLRRTHPDLPSAQVRAAELGPEAAVYNLSSGVEGLAGAVTSRNTAGAERLRQAVEQQIERSGPRMRQDIAQTFGPTQSAYQKQIESTQVRAGQRGAYQAGRQQPFDADPIISEINREIERSPQGGVVERMLSQSKRMLTERARAGTAPAGINDVSRAIDTRVHIDDMIRNLGGERGYEAGLKTPGGRALVRVRDMINDALPPEVRASDRILADDAKVAEALKLGREQVIGTNKMDPEELAARVNRMSVQERLAATRGPRSNLETLAGDIKGNRNAGRTLANTIDTENNLKRIEIILGKPGLADQLRRGIAREDTLAGGAHRIIGNSLTAERLAGQQALPGARPVDIGESPAIGIGTAVLSGNPAGLLAGAVKPITNIIANAAVKGRGERIANDVADLLRATGGDRDAALLRLYSIKANLRPGNKATVGVNALIAAMEPSQRRASPSQ